MIGADCNPRYWSILVATLLLVPTWGGATQPEPIAQSTNSPVTAAESTESTVTATPDSLDLAPNTIEPIDLWQTGVSPGKAVLMSPVFPGWGQLYAQNNWRASIAFGVQMYYLCNMFSKERMALRVRDYAKTQDPDSYTYEFYHSSAEELWEQMRDFIWWAGGSLLILALDAYVGAHLFEFDTDPVPVPNRWDEYLGSDADELAATGGSPAISVFRWHLSF